MEHDAILDTLKEYQLNEKPYPRQTEQALVALCADDRDLAEYVLFECELLTGDIGTPQYERAWRIVAEMVKGGRTPAREIVLDEYRMRFGEPSDGLLEVASYDFSKSDIDTFVQRIRVAAEARRLLDMGVNIVDKVSSATKEDSVRPGDLLSIADAIYNHVTEADRRADIITPAQRAELARQRQQERQAADGLIGISWGFDQIDYYTRGLHGGRVYVVGGDTGKGKSTFLFSVAHNVAADGHNVLYVSQEMLESHVTDRELARIIQTNTQHIESGELRDMSAFERATKQIERGSLYVYDRRITAEQLVNLVWTMDRKHGGIDLLVTDYVQEFSSSISTGNRQEEITRIMRAHRDIGRDFDIPVLTASQLNRMRLMKDRKKPQIGDFRESAAIEQVAWMLLGIFIPSKSDKDGLMNQEQWNGDDFLQHYKCPQRQTGLTIPKNRSGPSDVEVRIGWNPENAMHYQPHAKGSNGQSEHEQWLETVEF